jgi:hypothetical protein
MPFPTSRTTGPVGAALALTLIAGCGGSDNPQVSFPPYETEYGLVVADVSGDGLPDVISARTLNQATTPTETGSLNVYVHGAGATSGYTAPVRLSAGREPLYLAAADVDHDGHVDVVAAEYDDAQLAVYLNQGAQPGTFAAPLLLPSPGASQVAIADLNDDGFPDLVSADFAVHVFLQDAANPGTFLAPFGLSSGGANWVAIGDLNHDGLPDVVVTDATGVKVYLHAASPTSASFLAPVTVFTQTPNQDFLGANYVAIADLDGDGYNDLVITDPGPWGPTPPTVNVLLQDSAAPGTFLAAASFPVADGEVAQSIVIADLDGDGHKDVIVGDRGGVSVLLQNAGAPGTLAAASRYRAPYGVFQAGVADVDGDGHPDIVVTNTATSAVVSGTETMQPGVLLQVAAAPGTFKPLQDLP